MDRVTFRRIVADALAEVLESEYPGEYPDNICRIVGLPEIDNEASDEWGAEIQNNSQDAIKSIRRIFVPKNGVEEEVRKYLEREIYSHCISSGPSRG